jgi:hypothetical protein
MKLKLIAFLTLVFAVASSAFGQKAETSGKSSAKTAASNSSASSAKLPSAKQILDKYVEAVGGRAANEKIKTRLMKGTIEMAPMGIKGTVESYAAAPDKTYTKMNIAGIGEIVEVFDGTNSWSVNPVQGSREKTGEELLQTKMTSQFNRELNLAKLYPKIEVRGAEKLGDRDVYVLVGAPNGLAPETFYFDRETGLLLKSDGVVISPEGKMPYQTFYEDVRAVDGVKMPFKTRTVMPQFEIISVTTEVKNNPAIDAAQFSKPKQ